MLLGIRFGNNLNFGNVSELFLFSNGFPWVAKGVSEGVSEGFPEGFPRGFRGFPGGSSMTLSKTASPSTTFFAEFCSSVSVKTGVSNASEWPYYNIWLVGCPPGGRLVNQTTKLANATSLAS